MSMQAPGLLLLHLASLGLTSGQGKGPTTETELLGGFLAQVQALGGATPVAAGEEKVVPFTDISLSHVQRALLNAKAREGQEVQEEFLQGNSAQEEQEQQALKSILRALQELLHALPAHFSLPVVVPPETGDLTEVPPATVEREHQRVSVSSALPQQQLPSVVPPLLDPSLYVSGERRQDSFPSGMGPVSLPVPPWSEPEDGLRRAGVEAGRAAALPPGGESLPRVGRAGELSAGPRVAEGLVPAGERGPASLLTAVANVPGPEPRGMNVAIEELGAVPQTSMSRQESAVSARPMAGETPLTTHGIATPVITPPINERVTLENGLTNSRVTDESPVLSENGFLIPEDLHKATEASQQAGQPEREGHAARRLPSANQPSLIATVHADDSGYVPVLSEATRLTPTDEQQEAAPLRDTPLSREHAVRLAEHPLPRNTVLLQLQPPELGHLQVRVRLIDDRLTAAFWAESPEVRALIQAHLSALHRSLSEQGFQSYQLSTTLASGEFIGHPGQFAHQHAASHFSSYERQEGPVAGHRDSINPGEGPRARPGRDGLVDVVI